MSPAKTKSGQLHYIIEISLALIRPIVQHVDETPELRETGSYREYLQTPGRRAVTLKLPPQMIFTARKFP